MEEPPTTTFRVNGAAIRIRRIELGMNQADCAAAAGISSGYLRQLELGFKHRTRRPTYTALRTALQIEPTDSRLLSPTEDPPRKE
ncbi:helix-turn-helix domain-containing protein [Streptomyces sp. NPDC056437]|uniref:helix-turn-helix domain-containing protein n=1 Tax=Streptomyces sp. NPDC056437 TaxID=3345816 RepID=UPI00369B5B86